MQIREDSEESKIILKNTITNIPITLPGVLQNISIGGEILWDNSGSTGKENKKVAKGYKEKSVIINLLLLGKKSKTTLDILDKIVDTNPKTPYQILSELEHLFKETEETSGKTIGELSKKPSKEAVSIMPSRYVIKNEHINNRGINIVCFVNLTSTEDNTKDYIRVAITFEEIVFPVYEVTDVKVAIKNPL